MVRPTFAALGLGAGETAAYVAELLVRFARTDQLYRLRDARGRPLETVTDMLVELMTPWASAAPYRLDREVELRRHCGDFALFMSGIFRPHVERGQYLSYYLAEGADCYRVVGDRLELTGDRHGALFRALGERFAALSSALDYMRKVYMVPAARSGPCAEALRGFDLN